MVSCIKVCSIKIYKQIYDIRIGSNGAYFAKTGYELVTGLGTPVDIF
jgi:hypothetical protein